MLALLERTPADAPVTPRTATAAAMNATTSSRWVLLNNSLTFSLLLGVSYEDQGADVASAGGPAIAARPAERRRSVSPTTSASAPSTSARSPSTAASTSSAATTLGSA